ncbi:MAG: hypothetical protein ACO1QB_04875 [Verrucomicrobiales bacterium]
MKNNEHWNQNTQERLNRIAREMQGIADRLTPDMSDSAAAPLIQRHTELRDEMLKEIDEIAKSLPRQLGDRFKQEALKSCLVLDWDQMKQPLAINLLRKPSTLN